MGRSKFIYGGEVLLDLTADTVEPGKVLLGFKYHLSLIHISEPTRH